ncbi:DNA-binding response OmpR family regulator [Chryseobacterium bernardetii]|jgi:DNA-binding response OmpR family regulator|uniref:DNA-binding response OmpR family regulator n=3 Tax=Chryseobacterium TaxID=59732 RepID=A0A543EC86_9FLAO|nr:MULTISPECIES: response regulator transcription factor [Chryseobacterium]MDR6372688.1 DNA-binding response OmpR family regulator [Chryseobacterium vietnamense]MDR6442906.1 DNA-binding response OmpR family regulator [Chryseobacterium bernardetii]MDR6460051.1 DNA-binding response OmpR family regulator [Chryseobacterium vietnamense]MDR6489004.1 DNA-binding response OmpR family regulator [Chryseobacterium vietnamense]TQM19119.1 DNA-binding response OmpR family regulator [Chryseobacterium aquifri
MKILIVEDNSRVSSLLKRGLESQQYQVYISEDAEDAIVLLNKITFDLAITDIMLPKMSGIDLCKLIKQQYPDIPIIMLTALGTIDEKIEGFDAGADDYMVKPFEIRELYVRIKAILQRRSNKNKEAYLNDLEYYDLKIDRKFNRVFRNGAEIELTPKEFKLLVFLVSNAERILTREEIAENVWGNHFDTGTNYIDVYIAYLRKKIDKNFDHKLIHTKPGVGFIFASQL